MARSAWTRSEMVLVLAFYATLEPKNTFKYEGNEFSRLLDKLPARSVDSVKMRISNYVARDPRMKLLGISGLFGGGEHVDDIWEEFFDGNKFNYKALLAEVLAI